MKSIELTPREINPKELVKRTALEEDTQIIHKEPGVYCLNGEPKIIYGRMDDADTLPLKWAVKNIKFVTGKRTEGLLSTSRIFGYRPRNELRQDFCSSTSLALENPKAHEIICRFGVTLAQIYSANAPQVHHDHRELVRKEVKEGWMIPGTPFTSGIVNKNNPLKYHYDAGNFKNCMSSMVVFRRGIEGGRLSVPEFNCRFDLEDNAFLLFDGQSILHGVTPINRQHESSYRYSVVYYSLQKMKGCLSVDEECKRIRSVKKERENKRLLIGKEDP